ncbi:MAG: CDP-alcohol phosphatidyltransferase family protein [Planctomycetes bacterium]|nr:CDP-alcohol phosphatidyltransferase family protein [Planctomycetota bacterium]
MNPNFRRLIPNGLSLTRLVLGVAFPWLPVDWRLAVVTIAAVTDLLDGLAARWLHGESETGRVLDPLADKVFVLALLGTLVAEQTLPLWWALAVLARDIAVTAGIAVVFVLGRGSKQRRFKPTWLGKCATAAQFGLLIAMVLTGKSWLWLLLLTAGLSIAAAVDYLWTYIRCGRSEH